MICYDLFIGISYQSYDVLVGIGPFVDVESLTMTSTYKKDNTVILVPSYDELPEYTDVFIEILTSEGTRHNRQVYVQHRSKVVASWRLHHLLLVILS